MTSIPHMIEVKGAPPWANKDIGDLSNMLGGGLVMFAAKPEFRDGRLIALNFDVLEYYVSHVMKDGHIWANKDGEVAYFVVSRPLADKERYPHWPEPEPQPEYMSEKALPDETPEQHRQRLVWSCERYAKELRDAYRDDDAAAYDDLAKRRRTWVAKAELQESLRNKA